MVDFYLSPTKNVGDGILLNTHIAGAGAGGISVGEIVKDFKIENNTTIGTGRLGSGKFTLKSTNFDEDSTFSRYRDFAKYLNGYVYLIAVLDNGKSAYIKAIASKSSLAEIKRTDYLNVGFSIDFISDYAGWQTSDYTNQVLLGLGGNIEVILTQAQNILLQGYARGSTMFFKINSGEDTVIRFELKKDSVLLSNQASFVLELDKRLGSYYRGTTDSRSLIGNFSAEIYREELLTNIESFTYKLADTLNNSVIADLQVNDNIIGRIMDIEVLEAL